jgi:hypothetical protein
VKRAEPRGYDDPLTRGRHHELAADTGQQLMDWITAKAANNVAVNHTEFLHECDERAEKSITRGWVDYFLTRHAEQLFETKSVLQESPRLEVPRVFLQAGLDGFRDHVHSACSELVLNLDEIGISEWEDHCTRRVIVPLAMKGQTIFYGVRRNLKHLSVVVFISVTGEHMTPCFVSSHVNPTAQIGRVQNRRRFNSQAPQ